MELMRRTSHLSGGNVAYIEQLYENFLEDPASVPEEWREHFEKLPRVEGVINPDVPHAPIRTHFELLGKGKGRARPATPSPGVSSEHEKKQVRVLELISAYRHRGHKVADIDPLGLMQRAGTPVLDLAYHRLSEADLDTVFQTGSFFFGEPEAPLREILRALNETYCGTVGAEFMHISDEAEKLWVQQRLESVRCHPDYSDDVKRMVHERLTAAEGLEKYLHNRYPGTKRFGLEGGESLIPAMHECLQRAGSHGVLETVIGMAHRGRLNVLVNILGKQPEELFDEFEGKVTPETGSGDVKYHQGFSTNVATPGGEMHVALAFNPSHLEIVGPVVEGSVRARQDRRRDYANQKVLPVILHGDAAFAGQGVVMETFQMSQTRGFKTGGTIHVVINNQVGFTTHRQDDARSTEYCTEIAKMVQAPIMHVNGDDPEAVLYAMQMAVDYRQEFKKDFVIDLVCYRRRGHNEGDDPSYTQPLMYDLIEQKRSVRKLYTESLIGRGDITIEEAEQVLKDYQQQLERVFTEVREATSQPSGWTTVPDYPDKPAGETRTAVDLDVLKRISDAYVTPPEGFTVHPKVMPQLQRRATSITEGPIDWGTGEILAFGSLLMEGRPVRLAGQDSRRGTFVSRFATIIDRKNADEWTPLSSLTEDQAKFYVYDSLLSEYAALGFEYGYSVARPEALVLWEAQFGDFVNGAQTVIDEFITSGKTKWRQDSGVVLLLPHGYEGQGPDHSSARIERFLQMAADEAFVVAQPSTPASYFHLLRHHSLGEEHRPLIVFTPKSMLKRKEAASTPEEFTSGSFRPFIGDADADPQKVDTLLLCSGRVTWDLMVDRAKRENPERFAIARIEQLYPRPLDDIKSEIARYPHLKEVRWVQDEPRNNGPWPHYALNAWSEVDATVVPVTRPESSSPSVGTVKRHQAEQKDLLDQAFA